MAVFLSYDIRTLPGTGSAYLVTISGHDLIGLGIHKCLIIYRSLTESADCIGWVQYDIFYPAYNGHPGISDKCYRHLSLSQLLLYLG